MILFHNDFGSILPSNYCNPNLKIVSLAPDVTILSFLIESFNHLRISAPLSNLENTVQYKCSVFEKIGVKCDTRQAWIVVISGF